MTPLAATEMAANTAEARLRRVIEQWPAVYDTARRLQTAKEDNHFSDMIASLLAGRRARD